jgi:hypothetical protein
MQTTEGRRWFKLHRSIQELFFNLVQDIQSTIAGFVSVAGRQGYHNYRQEFKPIATEIFVNAQLQQGKQLCQDLQGTILTMTAGPYKEASFVFKIFQPPNTKNGKLQATPPEKRRIPANARRRDLSAQDQT